MSYNPFLANVPNLYPLKTLENLWFSGVFRGYEMGTLTRNGLPEHVHTRNVFSKNDFVFQMYKIYLGIMNLTTNIVNFF